MGEILQHDAAFAMLQYCVIYRTVTNDGHAFLAPATSCQIILLVTFQAKPNYKPKPDSSYLNCESSL